VASNLLVAVGRHQDDDGDEDKEWQDGHIDEGEKGHGDIDEGEDEGENGPSGDEHAREAAQVGCTDGREDC
jgi:hypothetical protein